MAVHVDPDRSLGFALKRLQQRLRARMDAGLAEFGLTAPQYGVLVLLAEHPGISNAELARKFFVTPPTMIRMVTALEEAGLLVRHEHPAEGRVKKTELTGKGRARLNSASAHVRTQEELLAKYAGEHRAIIWDWLNTCADALE